jgi:hypothetical protein
MLNEPVTLVFRCHSRSFKKAHWQVFFSYIEKHATDRSGKYSGDYATYSTIDGTQTEMFVALKTPLKTL